MQGVVFNIQRHSIHDGPGIRTTVFLKGCNLRCLWCQNPESIDRNPQLQFYPQKCIGCGECRKVGDDIKEKAAVCNAEALVLRGKIMTVDEVMFEVDKDRDYYKSSGGGVTFSGGEPLLQADFLKSLLIECKNRGYNTAVDTAGNVLWQTIESVMPYVDLWLYDVKLLDSDKHKNATGVSNETILNNLRKISSVAGSNIIIRVPVIPGINDEVGELENIADMLFDLPNLGNLQYIELLPLNHFAEGKYDSLGMDYKVKDYPVPTKEDLHAFGKIFSAKGLPVKC